MQYTDPKQLSKGAPMFVVSSFGSCGQDHHCCITEYQFVQATTSNIDKNTKTFADILDLNHHRLRKDGSWDMNYWTPSTRERNSSMQDMGIIANGYNKHLTFDNLQEAQQYAESVYGFTNYTPSPPSVQELQAPVLDDADYDR
jgi:hypothetical protein